MQGPFRNTVVMVVLLAMLGAGVSVPGARAETDGGFQPVTVNDDGGSDNNGQKVMVGLLVVVVGILLYLGFRSDQRRSEAAGDYRYACTDTEEPAIMLTPSGLCARF